MKPPVLHQLGGNGHRAGWPPKLPVASFPASPALWKQEHLLTHQSVSPAARSSSPGSRYGEPSTAECPDPLVEPQQQLHQVSSEAGRPTMPTVNGQTWSGPKVDVLQSIFGGA